MENTIQELSGLLSEGPVEGKENIYMKIFDVILSCTAQEDAKAYFTAELVIKMMKFSQTNSPFNKIIYQILTNLTSEETFLQKLPENVVIDIISICLQDVLNINCENADLGCMLLSNITRSSTMCEKIVNGTVSFEDMVSKIISLFTSIDNKSKCPLDQLAMVLCNLSQLSETRKILTRTDHCTLQKLVPFINHSSAVRRKGIIGLVHNLVFDSTLHKWMLSQDVDILPPLLLPLAGPEQFDDEDNDKLPIDLQYLPDTKTRDPDPEIRIQLLESLNQLCATKFGRQYLRDCNAYIILRELHKTEKDPSVVAACENVVDILIRTEEEIGIDELNKIDIPSDLEEKFNKELSC